MVLGDYERQALGKSAGVKKWLGV